MDLLCISFTHKTEKCLEKHPAGRRSEDKEKVSKTFSV